MLKDLRCEYIIVGHSERRAIGDSDLIVAEKVSKTIEAGMKAVLCVGEKDRDHGGEYLRQLEEQIHHSLAKLNKKKFSGLIVAYEPIWAVGKGHEAIDGHALHQITLFIKKVLVDIFGKKVGMNVPILYGGSVDADNCKEIMDYGAVDGLLVGRASLNPHVFADIIRIIEN